MPSTKVMTEKATPDMNAVIIPEYVPINRNGTPIVKMISNGTCSRTTLSTPIIFMTMIRYETAQTKDKIKISIG